ncbi:MAG: hypothetical protein JW941_12355 [Candidatus Coatesbacteria bacterium]|nr:hypothetical protein [Candidatus Coatesbacteria bacterium]
MLIESNGVSAKSGTRDSAAHTLRIILSLLMFSAIISLIIWSSAIVTKFMMPNTIEAEDIPQRPPSYKLLASPISITRDTPLVKSLSGLARGKYVLGVDCRLDGGALESPAVLAAFINGHLAGKKQIASAAIGELSMPIIAPSSKIELGLTLETEAMAALEIDQIRLSREYEITYKELADRYGFPRGRRIDFQNPLEFEIDLPDDVFAMMVSVRADGLTLTPPELVVSIDGEVLGECRLLWLKWSDYLFGLEGKAHGRASFSIGVKNADGIAVVDKIAFLDRSKGKAYTLNVLASLFEAVSAKKAAAECYLAALKFYPENWRSKNSLLHLIVELDMPDEAASLLKLFGGFQPHFENLPGNSETILKAASILYAYGAHSRAFELIDRYFRTYDLSSAEKLLKEKAESLRAERKSIRISDEAWTLIPAEHLYTGDELSLVEGREVSAINDSLSRRPDANSLVKKKQEVHLLEQVYDVPSGLLSPSFVLATPQNADKLLSGWEKPQAEAFFIWGTGDRSELAIDLEKPNDLLLTFRVMPRFVYNLLPRMVVSFNGHELREIILLPGWHEYQTFVPANCQKVGRNVLSISYKYFGPDTRGEGEFTDRKVAFHYVELWQTDARFKDRFIYETGTIVGNHRFDIDGSVRQTLFIHPPRAAFYPIVVWPDTTLSFGIGISEKIWDRGGDGTLFRILLYPDNTRDRKPEPIVLFERFLDACGNPDERHWFDYELDLSQYSSTVGKLAFETLPGDKGDFWYDWSGFSDPVIKETIEYIDLSGKSLGNSFDCKGGEYAISVLAKGSPVDVVPPLLGILIDGKDAQLLEVKNPEWAVYGIKAEIPPGRHSIALYFANETDLDQSWKPMRLLIGGVGFLAL